VDGQTCLYSFVTIDGIAEIISDRPTEIFIWARIIAARYMGKNKAEEYGKRNSSEGELLLIIKPTRIIGQKNVARW
jgi:hypothetical protein